MMIRRDPRKPVCWRQGSTETCLTREVLFLFDGELTTHTEVIFRDFYWIIAICSLLHFEELNRAPKSPEEEAMKVPLA
jgi:hypothetical protein